MTPGTRETETVDGPTVTVSLQVNGAPVEVTIRPDATVAEVVREQGLTGTKIACARGECGACTVLHNGVPVLSCILLAVEATGELTTIEGLADDHRVLREAFADHGAFQCGYCTPGQIVRSAALLDRVAELSDSELAHELSGNICRCTGYVQIFDAVRAAAAPRSRGSDG